MKEFDLDITPYFMAGLRKNFRVPRNTPGLIGAHNVKVTDEGLVPYEPVQIPFSISELNAWNLIMDWPFPQLHRGSQQSYLTARRRLFYLDEVGWTLQEMDIYDYTSPSTLVVPIAGGTWQHVDLGNVFFFTNGKGIVFRSNLRKMLGQTDKIFYSGVMRATAGCYHQGRAFLGGFDPDYTWSSKMSEIFALGSKSTGTGVNFTNTFTGFRNNFVLWSTIGGGDLLMWLDTNTSNMAQQGWIEDAEYSTTRPLIYDYLRRNEMGWMPLEWQGMIHCLKPFGRSVVAYGDGGVSLLSGVTEPVSTVGQKTISKIGIMGPSAVAGDDKDHVWMAKDGALWHLSENGVQRLDYREHFGDFLNAVVVINFEPNEREWWISSGFETFVLTKKGLSSCSQAITSLDFTQGGVIGFGTFPSDMTVNASVVTDTFDMGYSGLKMLRSVEIGALHNIPIDVAIDYRYRRTDAFTRTAYKSLPQTADRGFVVFPISAMEFRLVFRWSDFREVDVPDRIIVKWQRADKTNVRGLNADKAFA